MDERYWIVNDCIDAVRGKASNDIRKLELEVKLLQLRVELLKCETPVTDVEGVMPFQTLGVLVQEFLAQGHSKGTLPRISLHIDELLGRTREQAMALKRLPEELSHEWSFSSSRSDSRGTRFQANHDVRGDCF